MKPLFITGYMASGKTTFGRALAARLGRQFIDLDFYIEQRFRRTVSQLFAERGEAGFRELETQMLREVGEFEDVIISCGGGTPCFNANMEYMNHRGTTVYLDTPRWRIVERLVANSSRRPLMAGKSADEIASAVDAGLDARLGFYTQARIHFSGQQLEDRRQISRTVDEFLNTHHSLLTD